MRPLIRSSALPCLTWPGLYFFGYNSHSPLGAHFSECRLWGYSLLWVYKYSVSCFGTVLCTSVLLPSIIRLTITTIIVVWQHTGYKSFEWSGYGIESEHWSWPRVRVRIQVWHLVFKLVLILNISFLISCSSYFVLHISFLSLSEFNISFELSFWTSHFLVFVFDICLTSCSFLLFLFLVSISCS